MTSAQTSRGVALILVLWLVAGLSLVVVAGSRLTSSYTKTAGLELERQRVEALLDGAISLTAQRARADPVIGKAYRRYALELDSQKVFLEVVPSKGLIDVNVASDELLQELLSKIGGLSADDALVMVSRIRDWTDPDDQPSGVGGAEAAQYRAANWPSMPRNTRMDDVQDLLSVLGMDPHVYERIRAYVGINGSTRIDVGAAPPDLLNQLSGRDDVGERIHGLPLDKRDAEASALTAMPWFDHSPTLASTKLRITASSQGQEGRIWQRQVWIDTNERPDTLTPWTTLTVEPTRLASPVASRPE